MTRRRERWSISSAILAAVEDEAAKGAAARLTTIATRANIAYDRLHEYLAELEARGLVTPGRPPRLTTKGRDFLRQYRQWIEVLQRFGFVETRNGDRALEDDPHALSITRKSDEA